MNTLNNETLEKLEIILKDEKSSILLNNYIDSLYNKLVNNSVNFNEILNDLFDFKYKRVKRIENRFLDTLKICYYNKEISDDLNEISKRVAKIEKLKDTYIVKRDILCMLTQFKSNLYLYKMKESFDKNNNSKSFARYHFNTIINYMNDKTNNKDVKNYFAFNNEKVNEYYDLYFQNEMENTPNELFLKEYIHDLFLDSNTTVINTINNINKKYSINTNLENIYKILVNERSVKYKDSVPLYYDKSLDSFINTTDEIKYNFKKNKEKKLVI